MKISLKRPKMREIKMPEAFIKKVLKILVLMYQPKKSHFS